MSKLLEERENGTYYLGDLSAAKAYLREWYGEGLREGLRENGSYLVGEYLGDDDMPHSWGCSSTGDADEAWRYFAGIDFGPMDEHYDEESLSNLLNKYATT